MTEKPQARLRPLEIRDVEAVAAYEREIAKISFPDDPITDLGFYVKKVRRLVDDRGAATFVAEDDTGVVGWAYVSKRQNFITKEILRGLPQHFRRPVAARHRDGGKAGGRRVRLSSTREARPRRVPDPRHQ